MGEIITKTSGNWILYTKGSPQPTDSLEGFCSQETKETQSYIGQDSYNHSQETKETQSYIGQDSYRL